MKYYTRRQPLPDFNNPAVWEQLKRRCFDGSINYEDFPAAEYKYFDRLRILYLTFSVGSLSRDDAEQKGKQFLKEYSRDVAERRRSAAVYRKYLVGRLRFGSLKIQINKAETAEDKLRYALELIGLLTDDELFVRVNGRVLK